MTRAAIAVALLLACMQAGAAVSVVGGGVSRHLMSGERDYTDTHDMVGVQMGSYMAVRFRNSYSQESYAAMYQLKAWRWRHVEARLYVGAVTGYDLCDVCPAAVPAVLYDRYFIKPGLLLLGEALALYMEVEL